MIANAFSMSLSPVHELQEVHELRELRELEKVDPLKTRKEASELQIQQTQELEERRFLELQQDRRIYRTCYSSSLELALEKNEQYLPFKARSHSNDYISSYKQRKQCQDLYQEFMRSSTHDHLENEEEIENLMTLDDSFANSTTHSSLSSSDNSSSETSSPVPSDGSGSPLYISSLPNNQQRSHIHPRVRFDSSGKIKIKTFSCDDQYVTLSKQRKLRKRFSLPLCHADLSPVSLPLSNPSESLSASPSDASLNLSSSASEESPSHNSSENQKTNNMVIDKVEIIPNNIQGEVENAIHNVELDFMQSDNLKNLKMLWKKGFISDTEFCLRKRQLTETKEENEKHLSRHEIARRITSPIKNHLPPDFAFFKSIKALKHTFDSTTRKWSSQVITVKIDREPFAQGGLRMVYHLQDLSFINQSGNPHATFVAKTAIDQSEDPATYFRDVEMQALASSYAQLYNSYNPPRRVQFLPAWILQLPVDCTYISQTSLRNTYVDTTYENKSSGFLENFSYGCIDKSKRRKYMFFGVEPYIKGEYHKHNNNYGYVSDLERNTPQAFSHFTYEASNNEILVVDIQGVMDHYTDPQIHTRSGCEFGKGNLSLRGFKRFFDSHRCNAICRYLKLPLVNPEHTNESKGTLPAQTYMKKQQIDHVSMELRHYYDQSIAFKKHATRNLNQMEMTSYTYNSRCSMCGIDAECNVQ